MAQRPVGQLTRKSIVDRALRRAGNSALASPPTYEAQIWLNQILYDTYTTYSWPFLRVSTPVVLNGQTFALPLDFLQTYNDTALVISAVNTTPAFIRIREVDQEAYLHVHGTGTAMGEPSHWYANRAEGVGYLTPVSGGASYTGTLYYQRLPAMIPVDPGVDGVNDNTIPEFPWADYLIQAVYVDALAYESDGRTDTEMQKRDLMLSRIYNRANPLRSQSTVLPLDANTFGATFDGD